MKLIDVSTRKHPNTFAKVSDKDFVWLNQWKWSAEKSKKTMYASRRENGKNIRMHRIVLKAEPGAFSDHRDGNGLHNYRSNLRACTPQQNNLNKGKMSNGVTSKYKGVCWDKSSGKFMTKVTVGGKQRIIGRYATEDEAGLSYNAAAIKYHGKFARLNIIPTTKGL